MVTPVLLRPTARASTPCPVPLNRKRIPYWSLIALKKAAWGWHPGRLRKPASTGPRTRSHSDRTLSANARNPTPRQCHARPFKRLTSPSLPARLNASTNRAPAAAPPSLSLASALSSPDIPNGPCDHSHVHRVVPKKRARRLDQRGLGREHPNAFAGAQQIPVRKLLHLQVEERRLERQVQLVIVRRRRMNDQLLWRLGVAKQRVPTIVWCQLGKRRAKNPSALERSSDRKTRPFLSCNYIPFRHFAETLIKAGRIRHTLHIPFLIKALRGIATIV